MATYFDAQSSKDITATDSFTHTPVGIPKGIVVGIAQNISSSDLVTAVTYGGVTMTRIATNGFANDTVGEPGAAYLYFLGSNIPTGAQTVAITISSGTDAKTAWCMSVTAGGDTKVWGSGKLSEDQTNPSVTVATADGYQGVCCAVQFSGLIAPSNITAGSGYTKFTNERDFGSMCAVFTYGQKSGNSIVINNTSSGDDCAFCVAAIGEYALGLNINNYKFIDVGNGMSASEKIR